MELRLQAGGPESWSADAVIVFLSEDEKLEKAYPELLDAAPWMSIAPGMRTGTNSPAATSRGAEK